MIFSPRFTRFRASRFGAVALLAILSFAAPGAAQDDVLPRCGTGVHENEADGTVFFPQDQIFCALLADPKEPRSFVSYLRGEFRTLDDPEGAGTNIGSVGLGDNFGLVRWGGSRRGEGVQLDLIGSIFAQFDLGSPSNDLINADYIVGLPVTVRHRGFSARVTFYHQSSHLGDEYLLRDRDEPIDRENLSFEAVGLVLSQEFGPLRIYGGGERLFRREPDTVAERLVHGGIEFRTRRAGPARFVAAVDMKSTEQQDWSPATSGRAGVEFARSGASGHPVRLVAFMIELYQGPSPYGQFFQDDISYVGFGLHVGL
jgi:Protein of unknown function (DUF1207)